MFKSWMWKQRSFREQHMGDEANGGAGGSGEAQVDAGAGADEAAGENDGQGGEAQATSEGSGADGSANNSDDEEVVITLGDEPAPADEEEQLRAAPEWVKNLRKADREKAKRIREQEAEIARLKGATTQQPQQIQVGTKPTLESCEYDESRFETELTAWYERKRQADEQANKQRKEQEDAQAAYQARLASYQTAKTTLKVPDFDDAEAVVLGTLSEQQQGIIVHGAKNHAALIYALGKNPAQLQKLAAIKDPIQYAFEAARLEAQLKVQPRKAAPAPERKVSGSAGGATGVDNQLERLRAEADRTGDRTKVAAYLRKQQQAA
jgi:hypothetical protein